METNRLHPAEVELIDQTLAHIADVQKGLTDAMRESDALIAEPILWPFGDRLWLRLYYWRHP